MIYTIKITGADPLIMHNGAGMDPELPENEEKRRITSTKASERTDADVKRMRELETILSLYRDEGNRPTIPAAMVRSCIETAARQRRMGSKVRGGIFRIDVLSFDYDEERYGTTLSDLSRNTQFTTPVVVQRARVLRTRAKFDVPWSVTVRLDCDDELVDKGQLSDWLSVAGRRIGIGDWRPEKSGEYGRFEAEFV